MSLHLSKYLLHLLISVNDQHAEFSKGRSICGCLEERFTFTTADVTMFRFVLSKFDAVISSHY